MKKRFIWTFDAIKNEALKYNTRAEFKRGKAGAYLAVNKMGRLDEVCSHMEVKKIMWTNEMLHKEALKYTKKTDFVNQSASAYRAALSRGIINEICSHMKKIINKWSKDEILIEALKYCKRVDFKTGSPKMYDYCVRKGWLGDIDIPLVYKEWTNEMLHKEALKYNTASDFIRGHKSAYQICQYRGILNEMCSHMEISKTRSDYNCLYIWKMVDEKWNDIQLYKIGVTSVRLGKDRIKQGSTYCGFKADIVIMKAMDNALKIEKHLLTFGINPHFTGFSGSTEVRALTEDELTEMLALL